jgi:hypothetical protein
LGGKLITFNFTKIFKKKTNKKTETPQNFSNFEEKPIKKKKNPKFIATVIFISALGFAIGYTYLNFFGTPMTKKQEITPINKPNPFETGSQPTQPIQPAQPTQPIQPQTTQSTQPAQAAQQSQQAKSESTKLATEQNQPVQPTGNKIYIPAKDILLNTTQAKQELENQIAILKAQVELKKLENELVKIEEDKKIIPISTKAQLSKFTQEIADKKVEPVNVPVIPPDLLSVYQINGKKIGVFSLGGIQIRASEGESVGEFIIQNIQNNQAVLKDSKNRIYTIAMKLPDKYSVGQPMFKKSEQTIRTSNTMTQQSTSPTYVPIVSEPIPPLYRRTN